MVGAQGWQRFGPDPAIAAWAAAARGRALAVLAQSTEPWRCGSTWFVGVDALPNDEGGSVAGCALPWEVFGLTPEPLHPAQLSVVRPGYPQPWSGESGAAQAYRLNRDAAHLDGLLPFGPQKRRRISEPHGWILGIALNPVSADASPLVVWEGSHEVMRRALQAALAPHDPNLWHEIDITDAYVAARREVFDTCHRVALPIQPGEATLLHRLMLHGVAPWAEAASAPPEGRMIAYFRPEMVSVPDWLLLP